MNGSYNKQGLRFWVYGHQSAQTDGLVAFMTEKGMNVRVFYDGVALTNELESVKEMPDVIILDRVRPFPHEENFVNFLKEQGCFTARPVILRVQKEDEDNVPEYLTDNVYFMQNNQDGLGVLLSVILCTYEQYQERQRLDDAKQLQTFGLSLMQKATFEFRTLHEARQLAGLIAMCGAHSELVSIGLIEIFINAIEHGSLEIGYDLKTELLASGHYQEEVIKRQSQHPYNERVVKVYLERSYQHVIVRVVDQGPGFDPEPYLEIDPARLLHAHGRGITIAQTTCFAEMSYSNKGNEVTIYIDLP